MGDSPGMLAFSPRRTALAIACKRDELKVLQPFAFGVPADLLREDLALAEMASPDFDREAPLCFDPSGRLMVTTGRTGGLFFWRLDEVRSRLKGIRLGEKNSDWEGLPDYPAQSFERVRAVVAAGPE
jgi:hypothetical protein